MFAQKLAHMYTGSQTVPNAHFLAGSCITAGYKDCCYYGDCYGFPPTCYCDLKCYLSGDCCGDIKEICFPGGEEINQNTNLNTSQLLTILDRHPPCFEL